MSCGQAEQALCGALDFLLGHPGPFQIAKLNAHNTMATHPFSSIHFVA